MVCDHEAVRHVPKQSEARFVAPGRWVPVARCDHEDSHGKGKHQEGRRHGQQHAGQLLGGTRSWTRSVGGGVAGRSSQRF